MSKLIEEMKKRIIELSKSEYLKAERDALEKEIIEMKNPELSYMFAKMIFGADEEAHGKIIREGKDPKYILMYEKEVDNYHHVDNAFAILLSGHPTWKNYYDEMAMEEKMGPLDYIVTGISKFPKKKKLPKLDADYAKMLYQLLYQDNIEEIITHMIEESEKSSQRRNKKNLSVIMSLLFFISIIIAPFTAFISIPALFASMIGVLGFGLMNIIFESKKEKEDRISRTKPCIEKTMGAIDSIEGIKKYLAKKYGFNYISKEELKSLKEKNEDVSKKIFEGYVESQEEKEEKDSLFIKLVKRIFNKTQISENKLEDMVITDLSDTDYYLRQKEKNGDLIDHLIKMYISIALEQEKIKVPELDRDEMKKLYQLLYSKHSKKMLSIIVEKKNKAKLHNTKEFIDTTNILIYIGLIAGFIGLVIFNQTFLPGLFFELGIMTHLYISFLYITCSLFLKKETEKNIDNIYQEINEKEIQEV